MSLKKFDSNDLFLNTIKTAPRSKFSIYNSQITYKQDFAANSGFLAVNDLRLEQQIETPLENIFDFSKENNSQYIPLI